MKLAEVDWSTITQAQARKLVPTADAQEKRLAQAYNRGECDENEWLVAFTLWENLRVFALCGEKPEAL